VANTIVDTVYSIAIKPVTGALGGLLAQGVAGVMGAGMPFANGGAFSQGKVMPFAKGGIVGAPTTFPMRGGRGLMGEAGPEAIMPLARGPDGRLGVQAGGGRAVNVVMNITTPDVQGFQRSQSQVAAQVSRALARGQRNR
jgi:lambda family phage tail tape measure protein